MLPSARLASQRTCVHMLQDSAGGCVRSCCRPPGSAPPTQPAFYTPLQLSSSQRTHKYMYTPPPSERKNVNLPGVVVDLPTLTDKDIDDLVRRGNSLLHMSKFGAGTTSSLWPRLRGGVFTGCPPPTRLDFKFQTTLHRCRHHPARSTGACPTRSTSSRRPLCARASTSTSSATCSARRAGESNADLGFSG